MKPKTWRKCTRPSHIKAGGQQQSSGLRTTDMEFNTKKWWCETAKMVEAGSRRFWAKRHTAQWITEQEKWELI